MLKMIEHNSTIAIKSEYFYPEDVIVKTDKNGKRHAKLGYDMFFVGGDLEFKSLLPVIFDQDWATRIMNDLHKLWLDGRERYRKKQTEELMKERKIISAFWDAHKVENYDPQNPKWTVSEWDGSATMEKIMKWYEETKNTFPNE